jgi:hypothetical protein
VQKPQPPPLDPWPLTRELLRHSELAAVSIALNYERTSGECQATLVPCTELPALILEELVDAPGLLFQALEHYRDVNLLTQPEINALLQLWTWDQSLSRGRRVTVLVETIFSAEMKTRPKVPFQNSVMFSFLVGCLHIP